MDFGPLAALAFCPPPHARLVLLQQRLRTRDAPGKVNAASLASPHAGGGQPRIGARYQHRSRHAASRGTAGGGAGSGAAAAQGITLDESKRV